MSKTLGRIGREAYEAKWREIAPEQYWEPFDPERDCSAHGDAADEAAAAAVVAAHEAAKKRSASATRVETGVVQFGEDWPGVFIRGDRAFALANSIRAVLTSQTVPSYHRGPLSALADLLESCHIGKQPEVRHLPEPEGK